MSTQFPLDGSPEGDDTSAIDANTTLDIFLGPKQTITELADTVDTMDGVRAETIDINNEKDGTHVEIISLEEPAPDRPGVDQVDNFVTVEGIGPEVAALLVKGGIRTFRQLAETPVDHLRKLLEAAGPRFRIHDATGWPGRAGRLADSGTEHQSPDDQPTPGSELWRHDQRNGQA